MKKIVYMSMVMQGISPCYKLSDEAKKRTGYDSAVCFPITAKLAENLEKDDDVLICIIKMVDNLTANSSRNFANNEEKLKTEIKAINLNIGAKISYKIIESDFVETKDAFGKRFMDMYDELSYGCKIYADVTFGTKPTSLLIMNILYFAEKFYNADIDSIIYGKILFIDTEEIKNGEKKIKTVTDPSTARICDVTMLYLLNNLTNSMNADSGEEAKKVLGMFFGI